MLVIETFLTTPLVSSYVLDLVQVTKSQQPTYFQVLNTLKTCSLQLIFCIYHSFLLKSNQIRSDQTKSNYI